MKTIPIPVQVPEWAKWIAQYENGAWFAYSCRPEPLEHDWSPGEGIQLFLLMSDPSPNWRETLREVE